MVPAFYPQRSPPGNINFVAATPGANTTRINLPLGVDIGTDFRRDWFIEPRSGSKNFSTFAGSDTTHRALGDPACRIDGGLGTNTVVYPGKRTDWVLTKSGSQVTVDLSSLP